MTCLKVILRPFLFILHNLSSFSGNTALHIAASKGYADIASLLLAEGADIKSKDAEGSTPLHVCSYQNKKILLSKTCRNVCNRS